MNKPKSGRRQDEPKAAASLGPNAYMQEDATEEEIKRGDYTEVTRLVVDHTPED